METLGCEMYLEEIMSLRSYIGGDIGSGPSPFLSPTSWPPRYEQLSVSYTALKVQPYHKVLKQLVK